MITGIRRGIGSLGAVILLSLAALVLAACGSAEEPATQAPSATTLPATEAPVGATVPATEPAATATSEPIATTSTAVSEPNEVAVPATPSVTTDNPDQSEPGNMAHLFTLPNARDGMEVSLESYRGDKNVVLVFYRGFW